jgi:hypothetical protein
MPLRIDERLTSQALRPRITRLFDLSARKIRSIEKTWKPGAGTPVFTVRGQYTSRGWTEWTQGFQFGSALLQYEATGEAEFLALGRRQTLERMATHVSHVGVHDHGFNNVSTYGTLWRLMREGRIPFHASENDVYELALKVSGAVQAARWTRTADGGGYIHSFNGPHSLFIDTMRTLRSLAIAHQLGHVLMGEQDERISLLGRLIDHAQTTATHNVFYGDTGGPYDLTGRVAHESVFNPVNGVYRCPSSQQGYSPFSTWTRGLAWAVLGFAEQLEFLASLRDNAIEDALDPQHRWAGSVTTKAHRSRLRQWLAAGALTPAAVREWMLRAATVTADFYLANCCADGIPMWDTGAPNLHRLADYLEHPADPYNAWEPVDSSAATIAAQGLLRLGTYLTAQGKPRAGRRYRQAGLTIARSLFDEPYLSIQPRHQGLILHSIYHRPNGWDFVARGQKVPNGESSMWGDYHARELALMLLREVRGEPPLKFFP